MHGNVLVHWQSRSRDIRLPSVRSHEPHRPKIPFRWSIVPGHIATPCDSDRVHARRKKGTLLPLQREPSLPSSVRISRQILESLDNHFHFIFQRYLTLAEHIQVHMHSIPAGGWNSCGKDMRIDNAGLLSPAWSSVGRESHFSRLPGERLRHFPGRRTELNYIARNVVRLDDIVRVAVLTSAPTTDFNIEFTTILLRTELIPGKKGQDRRRLEMRNVANDEYICPIPKTARKLEFRGVPVARFFSFCDAKVNSSTLVCPDVSGIK